MANKKLFFNRDLSWLSFNNRVLIEAAKEEVPLLERMKFMAIYSSNLDEFYRVRMPVIMALKKIKEKQILDLPHFGKSLYKKASSMIHKQQEYFGQLISQKIIPKLAEENVTLLYNQTIPALIRTAIADFFYNQLAAYIEIKYLKEQPFFPENNRLYLAVYFQTVSGTASDIAVLNIPSNYTDRFFAVSQHDQQYVVFIDDIVKEMIPFIFKAKQIAGIYSFKVTRDAELELDDEYQGDIAQEIEKQIQKRDFGLATRLLYQADMPTYCLEMLVHAAQLKHANLMPGGNYHNLKDFSDFPIQLDKWRYPVKQPICYSPPANRPSLFSVIEEEDLLINTPYQSYDTVLRFFNEAVIDEQVAEIYTTIYRVANDSRILHALISAARNGKRVTVFVELKARFDEENNLKWAKKMEVSGIRIIYSIPKLKVHAKVALVKKKETTGDVSYRTLLATGNLNENTARFYTDHILLTANRSFAEELVDLFGFLTKRKMKEENDHISFQHLLVAQFNLLPQLLVLIDKEIENAHQGLPASIVLKLNNLEEETLILKLYEASRAGVSIKLIIRGICRLKPMMEGYSENIVVYRIIDRYLEHGRIYLFHNNGDPKVYLGSADWMDRNIYRRIEVCFPIYVDKLKQQLIEIVRLQLNDDLAAVQLDKKLNNIPKEKVMNIRSQEAIYMLLKENAYHPID